MEDMQTMSYMGAVARIMKQQLKMKLAKIVVQNFEMLAKMLERKWEKVTLRPLTRFRSSQGSKKEMYDNVQNNRLANNKKIGIAPEEENIRENVVFCTRGQKCRAMEGRSAEK